MSKILVIDDEQDFLRVIARFLSRKGFEVAEASDGRTGVSLASECQPDLIVCDLNMPGMDGYEVLETLRRDPALADIPVIFLTGQSEPSKVRQGMNLGADDYLIKPVEFADLLGAIGVRLSRRQAQRQRQEKQMERATQLFGGIVHDLRDPLFVALGYTNLLRHGDGGAAAPEAPKQILDRMQQALTRMQSIIAQTLFLARSRMQRLPFDPIPFDLREFFEQLLEDHDQGGRLHLEAAAGRFPVTADPICLRQALDNLVSNALKYSDGPVAVSLEAAGAHYLIEVQDRGIGIPPGDQPEVFEPFFRASNTGGIAGHGLGLSIVKSCVEQHGGSIRFRSEAGRGTAFSIELPKQPPEANGAGRPAETWGHAPHTNPTPPGQGPGIPVGTEERNSPAGPGTAGKPRGMIVDDDPLVRSLLRDLLADSLEISGEAGTVAEARALAQQGGVDVVFLDVNLPDGKGFELLPDLKPGVPVVFVTSAEEYALHAFDCEAVDYLLKPVSPERLQKALERVRERIDARAAMAMAASSAMNDTFLVKTLTEKRLVRVREIKRIVAYGEYSWIYWDKGENGALMRKPLKQWLSELPEAQFVRVHRNAIVNLAYLERVEKLPSGPMQIHLRDTAEPIQASMRLTPALNRKLKAFGA
ncbi:MAG: response regulator [Verrucomicrobiota bacterium]